MKINYLSLLFISLIAIFVSCSDDPNSVGNVLVPDKDKVKSKVVDSYNNSFEQSFISFQKDSLFFGSSSRLLLGSYKNISSEALMAFLISLPDSIEVPYDSNLVTLKSSWIELYPNYWIGDSVNFNFTAHQINTSWNAIEINDDTVNAIHTTLGANILESLEYTPGDSVIKFTIDNNLVESWVKKSFDESFPENYGILLAPASSNGIMGFQGLTNFPNNVYPLLHMEFEKEGKFIDTVYAYPNLDLHLPTGERLSEPQNTVLLQSSIGVRGKLKFSLDNVPENILVNSAILDLQIDELNTFQGTIKTDTVAVSFLSDYNSITVNEDFGRYPLFLKGSKYSGEIRQFVQRWLDGEKNEGLEIKLSDENRSASIITFLSSTYPVDSLKPRLTIYYSSK
ncbi:MAG: DNRLRE domain-containing protein [Ignavibacteriales bacterium]|nr:DNRLRE domain-containing protein [Ignavibacteriales bacterium]